MDTGAICSPEPCLDNFFPNLWKILLLFDQGKTLLPKENNI